MGPPTPTTEVADDEPAAGAGEQSDDEPAHPADEARAARPARDPGAPTQAERDAHASTHPPFRSHCRQKRRPGQVPEVAFD